MRTVWLEASEVRRGATRWLALAALTLFAACGGGNRDNAGGTDGAAVTDSAVPAPADNTAPAVDSAASEAPDTAAPSTPAAVPDSGPKQSAQRPSKPSAPAKPAKPAAKPADTTAASAPTASKPSAPSQPSAAAPSTPSPGEAASEPLRDAYHQAPRDTVDQATYDGWKQFNLNCARCHGEDVMGTTIAPHLILSLKPDGPINTPELFMQTVCAGRPAKGMPAWCSLGMDPAKINQIYSYVKGRSAGKIGAGRPAVKQQG